jgi:hypothetical protein
LELFNFTGLNLADDRLKRICIGKNRSAPEKELSKVL